MVPGVPYVDRGNWGQKLALRGCSSENVFGKNRAPVAPYTFISHTKMSIVFGNTGSFTSYIA